MLKLLIRDNIIQEVASEQAVSGNIDEFELQLFLEERWKSFMVTLQFENGEERQSIVDVRDSGTYKVPWEVLKTDGVLWISAFGTGKGGSRITAVPPKCRVKDSRIREESLTPPSHSEFEQVLLAAAAARDKAEATASEISTHKTDGDAHAGQFERYETLAYKNRPGGYAGLEADGKINEGLLKGALVKPAAQMLLQTWQGRVDYRGIPVYNKSGKDYFSDGGELPGQSLFYLEGRDDQALVEHSMLLLQLYTSETGPSYHVTQVLLGCSEDCKYTYARRAGRLLPETNPDAVFTSVEWDEWKEQAENKVDKEAGKGLSSNDYSDADKEKLAGLNAELYETLERKNQPGGYAGLGSDGKLTSTLMGGNVIKEITANGMDNISKSLFPGVYLVSHPSGEWRGVLLVSYSMQLVSNEFSNTYYQMFILECGKIYTRNILAGTAEEWKSFVPIPVDSLASTETTAPLSAYQGKVLNETKVDKVSGKGLSSNDYTDSEKAKLAGKAEREKICSITVDIPAFTNQPQISGSLDTSFLGWNQTYYFVTLKNTDGTALAEGQFKLCNEIDGYASAVNQIFLLPGLDTGNSGILSENTLVDFKSVGGGWEMRLGDLAEIELPFTPSKNKKYIIEAELFRTLQRPGTTAANYNRKFSLKQAGLAGNYNCFIGHQSLSSIANQTFMQYNATPAEDAIVGKKLIKTMLKTEILYGYDYLRGYGTVTNYALGDVDSACTTAPVNAEISTKDRSELPGSVTRFTISTYFYGNAGKKFANGSRVIIREVENNANGI